MQIFLKIFGGIVFIFIAMGLILDNEFNVEKEIIIDASPEEVELYLSDLNYWDKWFPWIALDESAKPLVGEIFTGEGASLTWTGYAGGGSIFLSQYSNQTIAFKLTLVGDSSAYVNQIKYLREGSQTKVKWMMNGKMQPIIIGNYFALFMDSLMGGSIDNGLAHLKQVVEENSI